MNKNSYVTRLRNIAEQLDFLVEEALTSDHSESYAILEELAQHIDRRSTDLKLIKE